IRASQRRSSCPRRVIFWLDAQLPPALAAWITAQFGVTCKAVRDIDLRDATDEVIFAAAREAGSIVVTKDSDFVALVDRSGPPPQIVWLTIGNTSNAALRDVFSKNWPSVVQLLKSGEPLIEIRA